jgi:hypothetical protein
VGGEVRGAGGSGKWKRGLEKLLQSWRELIHAKDDVAAAYVTPDYCKGESPIIFLCPSADAAHAAERPIGLLTSWHSEFSSLAMNEGLVRSVSSPVYSQYWPNAGFGT